jgi:deoxyadenosine/deoxycytidine kinase
MKVAFTGSSGAGKTTLVTYVAQRFGLKHISGSAGDLFSPEDRKRLYNDREEGHLGVIRQSAMDLKFGVEFQKLLLARRTDIIIANDNFVTDRSPIDNLTYTINQIGYHPQVTDQWIELFSQDCLKAFWELTHVIYIRACQPTTVENNGSRIANWWYQQSIDAQFERWLHWFMNQTTYIKPPNSPKILCIDFWDLDRRKKLIDQFLKL